MHIQSKIPTQGDSIAEDKPIKLDFYCPARIGARLKFPIALDFCLADKAPRRKDDSKTYQNVDYLAI